MELKLNTSRKNFTFGLFMGFVLGIVMVAFVAIGGVALIIRDPHGDLAKIALKNAHLILGPLVSMKHLALNVSSKIKSPELKLK